MAKFRTQNPNYGLACDLLNRAGIMFYRDKLTSGGRSVKPAWDIDPSLHEKLARLADRVRVTLGTTRYHFYPARRLALRG